MAIFNGELHEDGKTSYFKMNNVLLRGSRIENTLECLCAVIFAGKETRLMQTQLKTVVKDSKMNARFTKLVLYQAILSIFIMLFFPLFGAFSTPSFHDSTIAYQLQPTSRVVSYVQGLIIFSAS